MQQSNPFSSVECISWNNMYPSGKNKKHILDKKWVHGDASLFGKVKNLWKKKAILHSVWYTHINNTPLKFQDDMTYRVYGINTIRERKNKGGHQAKNVYYSDLTTWACTYMGKM